MSCRYTVNSDRNADGVELSVRKNVETTKHQRKGFTVHVGVGASDSVSHTHPAEIQQPVSSHQR